MEIVLPLPYFIGFGKFSLLNSTSPSCFGELMLNRLTGQFKDLLCDAVRFAIELRHRSQHVTINLHACLFHAREHRNQWQIDIVVNARESVAFRTHRAAKLPAVA